MHLLREVCIATWILLAVAGAAKSDAEKEQIQIRGRHRRGNGDVSPVPDATLQRRNDSAAGETAETHSQMDRDEEQPKNRSIDPTLPSLFEPPTETEPENDTERVDSKLLFSYVVPISGTPARLETQKRQYERQREEDDGAAEEESDDRTPKREYEGQREEDDGAAEEEYDDRTPKREYERQREEDDGADEEAYEEEDRIAEEANEDEEDGETLIEVDDEEDRIAEELNEDQEDDDRVMDDARDDEEEGAAAEEANEDDEASSDERDGEYSEEYNSDVEDPDDEESADERERHDSYTSPDGGEGDPEEGRREETNLSRPPERVNQGADSDEEHYEGDAPEEEARKEEDDEKGKGKKGETKSEHVTPQPYGTTRPVSYSSVVYNPSGNSKTELSGSFYKTPLTVTPGSQVFAKETENASEDAKTESATTVSQVRKKTPRESAEINDDDDAHEEPETVTTNVNYRFEETIPPIVHRKIMNLNPIEPIIRPRFRWSEEEPTTERIDDTTESEYHEESVPMERYQQPKEGEHPKYSDRSRDGTSYENYHGQTINTRLGSKGKGIGDTSRDYETEADDMKKVRITQKGEGIVGNDTSGEDAKEEASFSDSHTEEDKNELYEYLMRSELDRRTQGETQSVKQEEKSGERNGSLLHEKSSNADDGKSKGNEDGNDERTAKAPKALRRYAFATIAEPDTDRALTYTNTKAGDPLYDRIANGIQSLFSPTTPSSEYEQRFSPSRVNCRGSCGEPSKYETFIQPSQTAANDDSEEDEENNSEEDNSSQVLTGKALPRYHTHPAVKPMKTPYEKVIIKKTVELARPATFVNPVLLSPAIGAQKVIRKISYSKPNDARVVPYSSTNQVLRIVRSPGRNALASPSLRRILLVRKV